MCNHKQVEWQEVRYWDEGTPEWFVVKAEMGPDGWLFWDRSMMDSGVRWYVVHATPELVNRAEQEWASLSIGSSSNESVSAFA